MRAGAGHQIVFRARLAQAQAERLRHRRSAARRRPLRPSRAASASVRRASSCFRPALDRPEARRDARLGGKRGEQGLRKAVDGLDAQAAAGRIEHLGEQAAGALARRRAHCPRPARTSSWREPHRRQPHPVRQPLADRLAISAAPALVKVRHRIDEGGVPRSSRRSTREVSTWVLPVPAEADSAAWTERVGRRRLRAFERMERLQAAAHRDASFASRAASA